MAILAPVPVIVNEVLSPLFTLKTRAVHEPDEGTSTTARWRRPVKPGAIGAVAAACWVPCESITPNVRLLAFGRPPQAICTEARSALAGNENTVSAELPGAAEPEKVCVAELTKATWL